ncbi:hypothetical protein GN956_G24459 [Arapaima gigas]
MGRRDREPMGALAGVARSGSGRVRAAEFKPTGIKETRRPPVAPVPLRRSSVHTRSSEEAVVLGGVCGFYGSTSDMTSSVLQAVRGGWRGHAALEESDGTDSSPEVSDRFRKLPSSSSLGSLGASLRKRLPLKTVQVNADVPPPQEILPPRASQRLHLLTRNARNSISSAYQKVQRSCSSQEECLVASPSQAPEAGENWGPDQSCTPHKPSAAGTPKRAPRSAGRRTPRAAAGLGGQGVAAKPGSSRRQLVRMAALRSPFASPNAVNRRREFDRNLEAVSSGLKKLKRLSRAFDSVIGRDDRMQAMMNYHQVMMRRYQMAQNVPVHRLTRASFRFQTRRVQETVGSWADVALSKVRKAT